MDRCTQLGHMFVDSILSDIYRLSLTKLLNLKSSVRQRRAIVDLIYFNIIAISLEVLTVVLVFVNQLGISHPVQTFRYIVKLKLEFIALIQLMVVAARGLRKESMPREDIIRVLFQTRKTHLVLQVTCQSKFQTLNF